MQVNQYVLFLKQLLWCVMVFLQENFLKFERGGKEDVFVRLVIVKKVESCTQWYLVIILYGIVFFLYFTFQYDQGYLERFCLKKVEKGRVDVIINIYIEVVVWYRFLYIFVWED